MKKLLLLLLVASPLLAKPAPPKRDWMMAFDDESPTAVLRVNYRSEGPLHSKDFNFDFEGIGSGFLKVTVTENVMEETKAVTTGQVRHVKLGTMPLTGKDPARFGKLLNYYKVLGVSPGTSSTPSTGSGLAVDHLVFQRVDGEKVVVLAENQDSTGALKDRPDLLTFDEIITRIRAVNPGPATPDDPVPAPHPK